MKVEQESVSPWVFLIYGGMGQECQAFYSRLNLLIARKRDVHKSMMVHEIRRKYATHAKPLLIVFTRLLFAKL